MEISTTQFYRSQSFTLGEQLFLYGGLAIVYVFGLFIPLMENDAAQHAVMAMRMVQENDFLHLFRGEIPYLDKPHMHFWLSAFSMKLFGINHIAYRLPAVLFTILGAYSCFRLAKYWYTHFVGYIAALVFLSTQAIFLANHDVRTDAVLTGATIFGFWQLVYYIDTLKTKALIFGALGLAVAFMTKGQLGVFVIGVCVLVYLLLPVHKKRWKIFLKPKTYLILPLFVCFCAPSLYAYYVQFGEEGIRFIFWDQSFNRLSGTGFKKTNTDYSFFFHTLLWVFFPWSFILYAYFLKSIKKVLQNKGNSIQYATSIGVLLVLVVISFSKSKLPHYLNSLLPIMAVGVAGYLCQYALPPGSPSGLESRELAFAKAHTTQIITRWNTWFTGILAIALAFVSVIVFWSYEMPNVVLIMLYLGAGYIIFRLMTSKVFDIKRLVIMSVGVMCFINLLLNSHFYPNLLKYQAGVSASEVIHSEQIAPENVLRYDGKESWSLDFYTQRLTPAVSASEVEAAKGSGKWLFIYEKDLDELPENSISIEGDQVFEINHYRITRLKLSFINPNTRASELERAYLVPL